MDILIFIIIYIAFAVLAAFIGGYNDDVDTNTF